METSSVLTLVLWTTIVNPPNKAEQSGVVLSEWRTAKPPRCPDRNHQIQSALRRRQDGRGFHVAERCLFQLRIDFVCDGYNVQQQLAEIYGAQIVVQGVKDAHL